MVLSQPVWFTPPGVALSGAPPSRSRAANGRQARGGLKTGCQTAMARSPNACFLLRAVGDDFQFEAINPSFEASTGLASALVVGQALQDVLPKAVAADIVERCRHCLAGAPQTPFVHIMPLPMGRTPWELSLTPHLDESGAVVGVFGTAREVSEGVESTFEDVGAMKGGAGRLPNIRFIALPDGRVERVDPSLLAMGGLPLGSSVGAAIGLVCPEDLARLTPSPGREAADAAYETDVRLRGPDGGYRWFRVRTELVDGLAGRRWYGVAIDVQDEKSRVLEGVTSKASQANVLADFGDCSVTIDRAWRITSLTPQAAAWVGRSAAQLLGADCRERLPVPRALIEAVEASLAAETPLQVELPMPNRPDRWMEFQIHPFAAGASIVFGDSAKPRRAGEAQGANLAWSRGALDASASEMALLDGEGVIISVNAAWRYAAEESEVGGTTHFVGRSYLELCKASIPDLDESALGTAISEIIAGHLADYTQPYVVAKQGGLWWRQLRILPFRREPSVQLIAIHEEITDVGQARAALRNTSEKLLSALAHERERIAFELHDSTSQHLTALGLGLIRLRRLVGDGAGELITDMTKSVQETVREIRVLSYLMKPSGLERDGLESAARIFASGFGARTGLQVEFRAEGDFRPIADAAQNAAFRVLQEALSNVYRHANAARVEVDLTHRGGVLGVRIADDGRGIPQSSAGQLAVAPGVGFASMESRVAQLGGTLDISRGAVGTIVEASIPRPAAH